MNYTAIPVNFSKHKEDNTLFLCIFAASISTNRKQKPIITKKGGGRVLAIEARDEAIFT